MPYRNKTYVAFDADSDIRYYRLMTAWKQSDHTDFNFYNAHDLTNIWQHSSEDSIKRSLRERLINTKIFVLLVGEKTKFLYRFVKWEIEQAQKMDLPIIVVNLNGKRGIDYDNCPLILKNYLALHVSFNAKIIQKSLQDWEPLYRKYNSENKISAFHYNEDVYKSLGL
ncbi:MAG: TIR domain-containing protein [Bacteroidia bacterium]|nr:TIR domain-containing protein [Bacteroidia bacterium]